MGDAIGQTLPLAVAVGLSPIPIVGVVLMLSSRGARSNGPAFLAGWIAGLTILGTIVLLVAGTTGAAEEGGPADWVNALMLLLGAALLALAVRQWRSRPGAGEELKLPGWMRSVERFTASRSAGLGVALSAVNPKNLVLVVGAAAAIAQTGAAASEQALALAIFVLIGSVGTALPIVLYFAMGERSKPLLDELKAWMSHNNAAIMAVIFLLIGTKLIGDGISGFST